MIGSSLTSPAAICFWNCSSVMRLFLARASSRVLFFAVHDDLLGLGGIGDHLELVAGFGQRFETEHFDRHGRTDFADLLAAIVQHGADAAEDFAADEEVADAQRAVANQHGGHRTAAAIELALR